jgi:hypothetical protein
MNNCIQLSEYSGVWNINYQYILKRREYRYKYQIVNHAVFGYEKVRKEKEVIYKGIISPKINEPPERKLEILNCECEAQTINGQSIVDMSYAAVEHNDMNKNHIGRQCQDVESFCYSIHGTTCQDLEIVQLGMSEEFSSF